MIKGPDFLPMFEPGDPPTVTRFAPTPSGYLHVGHAYAALVAWESARAVGGRFLLRMEDIDRQRCRREFEQGICDDLRWLGLYWDGPVVRQSDRMDLYDQALSQLDRLGVLYPCFCTRRRIRVEIAQAGQAPHGPVGEAMYPGICRSLNVGERRHRIEAGEPYALRLDVGRALELTGALTWYDVRAGTVRARPETLGDVVLARKDIPTSYHLAVTVDDSRYRTPSPSIRPVDTTGAGDTFVGALASMIGEKSSLKKALEVGCEAAALSCLKAGAQHGMPMRDALLEVPPRDPTTVLGTQHLRSNAWI